MTKRNAMFTLVTIMFISLLGTAGIALPYPVLAPFFLEGGDNGLTQFMNIHPKLLLGAAFAVYPLGILLGSSFVGALSDVYGRKSVLLWTLSGSAGGYMLTGLAVMVENYPLFLLARLLTGVCEGNIAIARAIAVELHPTIDRTRAISLVYATVYAGWLVGPLAGGYLMPFGAQVVFYAAAGSVVACGMLVFFVLGSQWNRKQTDHQGLRKLMIEKNSWGLLRYPAMRPIFWFYLAFSLGINAFYEFYPVWFVEVLNANSQTIAWGTVTLTTAMILASSFIAAPISNCLGAYRTLIIFSAILSVFFFIQPLVPGMGRYGVFALIGATIAIGNGVVPTFLSERFGHYGEGRVMGLQTAIFCFSNVLIAVFGSMIAVLSTQWALWSGAILVGLAGAWLALREWSPQARSAESPEAV